MTVPSSNTDPALTSPIVLTGEGLAGMTPDRFDMLDRMVHGIGLAANRGSEVVANTPEQHDPHAIARELIRVQEAETTLRGLFPSTRRERYDQALTLLVNGALWNRIERDARADPTLMHEVGRCLAAGSTQAERLLANAVVNGVFDTHVERGALDTASAVSDVWVELAMRDPIKLIRDETQDHLAFVVTRLDEEISAGRMELQSLLDKLWEAEGRRTAIRNAPGNPPAA